MEMLAVRAWKGTLVKVRDRKGHGCSRAQVVPPATALFYHTSQWQLRAVLAGVVSLGAFGPHLTALTYKKVSETGWCQPPFAASPGQGKEVEVTHRPQETETSSHPALPFFLLCFAMSTWASTSPNKIRPMGTPLMMFL